MLLPEIVHGVLMVSAVPPTRAPAVPEKVTPVPAEREEVATFCMASLPAPYRRLPAVKEVWPVPPPPTPRMPASVLAKVSVPLLLVMVVEAVRPLNAVLD